MKSQVKLGRWCHAMGGALSFEEEIKRAVEVGAQWRNDRQQRDILVDELPGWLAPLWGTKGEWLYLRRPEGVWKTKIPAHFDGELPISIYQKCKAKDGGEETCGGLFMGPALKNCPGWIRGAAIDQPLDAAEMDDLENPKRRGFDVEADLVGPALGNPLLENDEMVLFDAKDGFDQPPTFRLNGDWLLATDPARGRTIAYSLKRRDDLLKDMKEGRLWFRYWSRWLRSFDVKVAPNV